MNNEYFKDALINIDITESITNYSDTKDLKRDIDFLGELSELELVEESIVSITYTNEQKYIDVERLYKI